MFRDKNEIRKQSRILFVLGGGVFLACVLGGLGWRVLLQEQALVSERQRISLGKEASDVVRQLRASTRLGGPVRLEWQGGTLTNVEGALLAWWPGALPGPQAPADVFIEGEKLEFGPAGPQAAAKVYRQLLQHGSNLEKAGALVREARCLKKLGRIGEASRVYAKLKNVEGAWAAGLPAELLALRERAERVDLDSLLRQGKYRLDRATFALLAEGGALTAEDAFWAEAAEAVLTRARGAATGRDHLRLQGRELTATWSEGRATLAGKNLAANQSNWRLEDIRGETVWGGLVGQPRLTAYMSSAETGLPWGLRVALADSDRDAVVSKGRIRIWGAALGILLAGVLGASWQAARLLRKEMELARRQSEFVAAVSHEFRTPLAAMSYITEMLGEDKVEENRKCLYYAALGKETRRMKSLVEGLLEFGRMESGQQVFRKQVVDAGEFVRAVVQEFTAAPHGREPVFEVLSTGRVDIDRVTMGRAVWNLLDNAVKYSPPNEPVKVVVEQNGGYLWIQVRDQGPGIPPAERRAIFRKFVRGAATREGNVSGTGIGLALVEGIARAHGGRVELESEPGRGSRFSIILPEAP